MFKNALRKVFANGSVRLGGGVLLLLILMSIFAPWLGTIDPTMLDPGSQNLLPGTTNVFMTLDGDEFEHFFLMGSDSLGRDIWSRTLYGGRVSITLDISVALLAVFFGTVAGLLSGYFRWVDAVMMRVMDGFMSIPAILFAISLIAMFGNALVIVVTAIAIPSIPRIARLVRSVVLCERNPTLKRPLPWIRRCGRFSCVTSSPTPLRRSSCRAPMFVPKPFWSKPFCPSWGSACRLRQRLGGTSWPKGAASSMRIRTWCCCPAYSSFSRSFQSIFSVTVCAIHWTRSSRSGATNDGIFSQGSKAPSA